MSTFFKILILMCFQNAVPAELMDADNLKAVPRQLPTASSCETCTKFFDLLKDLLMDTGVQGMTESDMNTLCETLLGPGPDQLCQLIVDKNLPMVFTLADKVMQPGHICSALGFCADTEHEPQGLGALLQTALGSTSLGIIPDIPCQICTHLIDTAEALLPKDLLEDALVTVLEQGCNLLPSASKASCENFVDKATKIVIELLFSVVSPDTICTLLQLCTDSSAELPIMSERPHA